ncbi:hypothetical protein [Nocardioides sp.]|uniref:hypothetical protein n=1 Tax=Nocardioides sp. TaxID=35761 RepID=UPI003785299E
MRSTQLITGVLAVVATTVPLGIGGAAQAGEATTTHERGIVVECTGTVHGRDVFTSVYENDTFANVLQVLVGDDEQQVGGSRTDRDGFLDHGRVRAAMQVDGKRALVTGTARRVGDRIPVSEEQDDAGQHVTATGFQRSLDTDLTLTWRGATVPLDCATAFAYRLTVTKEPIE